MNLPADDRVLVDRRLRAWLDDGPDFAPRDLADDVMAPIPAMRRRHRWARYVPASAPGGMHLLAAAAVILVAVSLALITVLRPLPESGTVPTPAPTSDFTTNDFGKGVSSDLGRAGWYRSWQFRPQIRFQVPAGWGIGGLDSTLIGADERVNVLPLTNGLGGIVVTRPRSVDGPGSSPAQDPVPADLAVWILANPDLDLDPVRTIRIGGRDAIEVSGTLAPDAVLDAETGGVLLTDSVVLRPRHRFRLAVVPDASGSLVVATIAPATRYDEFLEAADPILASLTFVEEP